MEHKYRAEQFHFHWGGTDEVGAEHQIDGKTYAAEVIYTQRDYKTEEAKKSTISEMFGLNSKSVAITYSKITVLGQLIVILYKHIVNLLFNHCFAAKSLYFKQFALHKKQEGQKIRYTPYAVKLSFRIGQGQI